MGEIWLDGDGQHTLVTKTVDDDGEMFAHVICLESGEHFTREPFNSWCEAQKDGLPYYRVLVG